jgi:hypothetical protein
MPAKKGASKLLSVRALHHNGKIFSEYEIEVAMKIGITKAPAPRSDAANPQRRTLDGV